jgi:hydroxymethylpyrimidine/phosphomethylpyrimidine kinase
MTRPSGLARWGRPVALTIAGSDASAGAGIQADLKTFHEIGVYGTTAITALTAQNTVGVRAVEDVSAEIVAAQIDAVVSDLGVDAAKTGMLPSAEIVRAVAERVRRWQLEDVLVVDPVMRASSGDELADADAQGATISELLPLATVVTPNLHEAGAILGSAVADDDEAVRDAARRIGALGPRWVVIKGGHRSSDVARDVAFDGRRWEVLDAPRVPDVTRHGTGCTFSAAIAARIALGDDVLDALRYAKAFVTRAIERSRPIGAGAHPVEQAGSRPGMSVTGARS